MSDLFYMASQTRIDDLLRDAGGRRRASQAKVRPEAPSARILRQPGLLRRVALVPIRH